MKCPKCLSKELESNSPRTLYECGSSDYDQIEGTFIQSDKCIRVSAILESQVTPFKGILKW